MTNLKQIAGGLVAPGKGILAADESMGTCDKRFDKYGIPKTPEKRREWRELLLSTPKVEKGLSGVILFDETIRQKTSEGVPFAEFLSQNGIIPGIKVDAKTEPFDFAQGKPMENSPDEEVTKGLEGLEDRLREYARMGAKFTKWRAVIRIKGEELPTEECILENARRMAKYASLSQKAGLVPIVEPEVLLDGTHSFERSEKEVMRTLNALFIELEKEAVELTGLLLKTSMVLPGKDSGEKRSAKEIGEATVRALMASVPAEIAGVVFLSGGQTAEEATERLNEIVIEAKKKGAPWPLTFSFSRALQDPAMSAWKGDGANTKKAQEIFTKRVEDTALASLGRLHA